MLRISVNTNPTLGAEVNVWKLYSAAVATSIAVIVGCIILPPREERMINNMCSAAAHGSLMAASSFISSYPESFSVAAALR